MRITGITTRFRALTIAKRKRLLSRNINGHQGINKVHYRQWITSYTDTPTPIQRHFRSEVTKLNTNFKDVNDNQIEFIGQTKATVRNYNTTLQLPLPITKENITPVMGLDWMKRLERALNATMGSIKIHITKLDDTEKKILKIKNEFRDLIYKNTEIIKIVRENQLERSYKKIQEKRTPIPIHSEDQVAEESKRLVKNGYLERATETTDECFVSPSVITSEVSTRFKKIK